MSQSDFWAGIAVLVASQWLLGAALEHEFIKRMNRLYEVINSLRRHDP